MQQLKPSEISELLRTKIANLALSADVRTDRKSTRLNSSH